MITGQQLFELLFDPTAHLTNLVTEIAQLEGGTVE